MVEDDGLEVRNGLEERNSLVERRTWMGGVAWWAWTVQAVVKKRGVMIWQKHTRRLGGKKQTASVDKQNEVASAPSGGLVSRCTIWISSNTMCVYVVKGAVHKVFSPTDA
jgi:hypothetical protein